MNVITEKELERRRKISSTMKGRQPKNSINWKGKNHPMYGVNRGKEKHPLWKGGRRMHSGGYIVVWIDKRTYELEHRLVMERYLGRKLSFNENVHHKNGIKTDNRLENLQLLDRAEHARIHNKIRWSRNA